MHRARVTRASLAAEKRLESARPAITMVSRDAPILLARPYTTSVVSIAPVKAAATRKSGAGGNSTAASTTANPAPEFTPMVPGEARPFPSVVCSSRPDTASAAPHRQAAKARGMRM